MSKFLFLFMLISIFAMAVSHMIITDEELDYWRFDQRKKCPHCMAILSDESKGFLDDDAEADNGEIREFRACVGHCNGYIKSAKMNADVLIEDLKKYASHATPLEITGARLKMELCKREAEKTDVDSDVIGLFYRCIYDRVKYDL